MRFACSSVLNQIENYERANIGSPKVREQANGPLEEYQGQAAAHFQKRRDNYNAGAYSSYWTGFPGFKTCGRHR